MELVQVRPLQPFIGSYVCGLSECDTVDEVLATNENGDVIKRRVPRKRYAGMVAHQRHATVQETEAIKAKQPLPDHIEAITPTRVIEHPINAIVSVPLETANDLVMRGLAVIIFEKKSKKGA
jgi:hypothetical protein